MMTQIKTVAESVRGKLLAANDGDLDGCCFIAAIMVRRALEEFSVYRVNGFFDGTPHEWAAVEVDDRLIHVDPTASQFGDVEIMIAEDGFLPEGWEPAFAEWDSDLEAEFEGEIPR